MAKHKTESPKAASPVGVWTVAKSALNSEVNKMAKKQEGFYRVDCDKCENVLYRANNGPFAEAFGRQHLLANPTHEIVIGYDLAKPQATVPEVDEADDDADVLRDEQMAGELEIG